MAAFEFLVAIITVLSAVLLGISLLALKRERSWRLILSSVVFFLFLVEGLILSLSIYGNDYDDLTNENTFLLSMNVLILLFLFFSVFSPPKPKKKPASKPKSEDDKKR
jgi:ABC-type Fe3+ transport system permease subunit